ncbi:MAG TPA: sigma-70 family RNA polymerase sigma factor [Patescibacteria group bacterium]|nr:sigma-70 family RNA polymerase sigma factor [Patescibacteria group bacterium]
MNPNSVFSISSHGSIQQQSDFNLDLFRRAQGGDQAAFGEIYTLLFGKVYRFIFYRVGHKELAEDLAEEVFLKAFTKISSVSEQKAFLGWLYQIARNQVIDYYREKKITIALDEIENTLEYEANLIDVVNLSQQQKILLKIIKELAPEQQIVLKLKFFEELDNEEIAEMLHKSQGAIRVIQHRAITKLQELIDKLDSTED